MLEENTINKLSSELMLAEEKPTPVLTEVWRTFRKNKLALVGAGIVIFLILIAIFAPLISPEGINDQKLSMKLLPPSSAHWFGTDDFGRDILSRVIYGARISLRVGFLAVLGSAVIGTFLGIIAGYYGKWVDTLISRFFDILLAFPSILLAIAIVAVLGPSLRNALIAIAIVNVPSFGRLVRSKVLSLKQEEYIMAARSVGMRGFPDSLHAHSAEQPSPGYRSGHIEHRHGDFRCCCLRIFGNGRSAPVPRMGENAL